MKAIADGDDFDMPATIDDTTAIDAVKAAMARG